jgi:hypothetical protein
MCTIRGTLNKYHQVSDYGMNPLSKQKSTSKNSFIKLKKDGKANSNKITLPLVLNATPLILYHLPLVGCGRD